MEVIPLDYSQPTQKRMPCRSSEYPVGLESPFVVSQENCLGKVAILLRQGVDSFPHCSRIQFVDPPVVASSFSTRSAIAFLKFSLLEGSMTYNRAEYKAF